MKRYLRDYLVLVGSAGLIVLLDQLSKAAVRNNLAFGEMWSPWDWLMPYVRIVHWQNTGAAFGMLQGYGLVFTILAILVSLAILFYYPKVSPADWPLRAAMCLQLGGAVGNLVDRLTLGEVTDFFSVGNFAVFNVADASITMGVITLILGVWWKERQAPAQPSEPAAEPLGTRPEGSPGE